MPQFPLYSMNQKFPKRFGAVARIVVALSLATAFTCATIPLATVSAGNVCRLDCCAARAPHAAGSCMNGTCHAAIQIHQSKLHQSLEFAPAEDFCRFKPLSKQLGYRAISTGSPTTQQSVATLGQPCDADCGSCAVGSVSVKGQIAATPAYQQRPMGTQSAIDYNRISLVELFQRQYSPRGPPTNQK